jgi:hypothetical protein
LGDKVYVEKVKDQMGYKAIGRRVIETRDSFVLKEIQHPYLKHFCQSNRGAAGK